MVGGGGGIWSFIHVDDAAAATAVAVERGERGIYNVVDDYPEPVRDWLPELARALGAKPSRRVPSRSAWISATNPDVRLPQTATPIWRKALAAVADACALAGCLKS